MTNYKYPTSQKCIQKPELYVKLFKKKKYEIQKVYIYIIFIIVQLYNKIFRLGTRS